MAWTYLTTDFVTGRVLTQSLPLTGVTFTEVLNGAGSLTGQIDLADPTIDARTVLNSCIEGRTALYALSDGVIQWGGQVIASSYSSTDRLHHLTCRSMFGYFASLLIDPMLDAAGGSGGIISGPPSAAVMSAMYGVTEWASTDPDLELAANVPYWFATGGYPTFAFVVQPGDAVLASTWESSQWAGRTLDQAIADLSAAGDYVGFDFGFEFAVGPLPDGGTGPVPTFTIYYPKRGSIAQPVTFTCAPITGGGSVSSYTWPVDAAGQALRTTVIGAGSGASLATASRQDPTLLADGYPCSMVESQHSSVADPTMLASIAAGEEAAVAIPATLPTITVRLDQYPTIGTYHAGDLIRLRICDPARFPTPDDPDGTFGHDQNWRIQQIDTTPPGQSDAKAVLTLMAF